MHPPTFSVCVYRDSKLISSLKRWWGIGNWISHLVKKEVWGKNGGNCTHAEADSILVQQGRAWTADHGGHVRMCAGLLHADTLRAKERKKQQHLEGLFSQPAQKLLKTPAKTLTICIYFWLCGSHHPGPWGDVSVHAQNQQAAPPLLTGRLNTGPTTPGQTGKTAKHQ